MTDAKAFIGWLDQQASVAKNRKIGTQGYCMGGPLAFRTAAAMPDRVGAVASFHGGGLVTDAPNSPHLQAAKTKAQFLIAIAANDDQRAPKDKDVLKETFAKAKLPAEIEVYAGRRARLVPAGLERLQRAAGREGVEPACSRSTGRPWRNGRRHSDGPPACPGRSVTVRLVWISCGQPAGRRPTCRRSRDSGRRSLGDRPRPRRPARWPARSAARRASPLGFAAEPTVAGTTDD